MLYCSFRCEDAKKYGVNCAVILCHMFCCPNKWKSLPAKSLIAKFPWMTEFTARTCLKRLVAAGVLESERRGGNLDRTLHYRLRNRENLATVSEQEIEVLR